MRGRDLYYVSQGTDVWLAVVNTVLNLQGFIKLYSVA